MRAAKAVGKDWRKEIKHFLIAYRSTPHSVTGVRPAELLNGRLMHTKLPEGHEFLKQYLKKSNSVDDTNVEVKESEIR